MSLRQMRLNGPAGWSGRTGHAAQTECLFAVIKRDQLLTANKRSTHDGSQLPNARLAVPFSAESSVSFPLTSYSAYRVSSTHIPQCTE